MGGHVRDPNRIPLVLGALQRKWEKCPDIRLGQLLVNVIGRDYNLFGIEDDQLVRLLGEYDGMTEREREWVESEPARRSAGLRESLTLTSDATERMLSRPWRDT